jgi:hypothetical protein
MACAQKPDFVFRWNERVHLNRRGRQFSRLQAAEVCASAVVMLDTPRSEVVWEYWLPTPFTRFPFTSLPVRHRVPSGFKRTLPELKYSCISDRPVREVLLFPCSTWRQRHMQLPKYCGIFSPRPWTMSKVSATPMTKSAKSAKFESCDWFCYVQHRPIQARANQLPDMASYISAARYGKLITRLECLGSSCTHVNNPDDRRVVRV